MNVTSIQHIFSLKAAIISQSANVQGPLTVEINRNLSSLGLDSAYTRAFSNAELDGLTLTFDSWPNVELGGAAVAGDDNAPLLLASTHALIFYAEAVEPEVAVTGFINVTLTRLGGVSGAVNSIVAGESFSKDTMLGWPSNPLSSIVITGSSDLTNTRLVMGVVGSTSTSGTGYGY